MLTIALQLIGAAALAAAGQPDPSATTTKPAEAAVDKRICRAIVPTGSVMPKRFCLTRTEWRSFNALNQGNAENALGHRGTGMCDPRSGPC